MLPPMEKQLGRAPNWVLEGTFSTMAKLGWPGVTALEAWLHQSMGAGLGPGLGVPQGRACSLQCHGGWGGREGLAGSAPYLCSSPLGDPF